jgi:LPXTG-site transpeptidase (sortase) family protein
LQFGDIITYQTNFFTRNYKVDNIQTVLETDWSLLQETEQNKLTLVTCVANKKLQRLCVQATEIVGNDLK